MNPGFYKINSNGGLMYAPNYVYNANFHLTKEDENKETMEETDGWKWFNTDCDAYTYFKITPESNPWSATPLQAKIALNNAGILDQIETYLATEDKNTQLAWQSASEFRRDSVLLKTIAGKLNLSNEDLENLFIAAKEITV